MWSGVRKKMPGASIIIVGGIAVAISMLADSFLYLRHDILPIGTFFLLICVSAVVIRNLVQIMQQKDYLEEVITTDTLTGLNNRYHLDCLIKKGFMVDAGKRLYVLFLDLDRFKIINDEYGHKVGDAILRESSKRLKECFHRETDILCRYGGDEFVAFVSVKDNEGNIKGIIKRIKKRFEEPINVGDNIFSVGISIGVSEYHEGDDMEKTIHRSDNAMYEEKQNKMLAAVSSDNQTY
jgi:diguanylate cyclase (GGDEF)-like protein